MPTEFGQKILSILQSHVGHVVAQSGLKVLCAKLNVSIEEISPKEIPELAVMLGGLMKQFGKDSNKVAKEINSII